MSHRYCGRDFSAEDLHLIVDLIAQVPGLSRTALSQQVCQQLGWLKSDGGLKEMSCRVAMLRMQVAGLSSLPWAQGPDDDSHERYLPKTLNNDTKVDYL